jgi:hypothetical protein
MKQLPCASCFLDLLLGRDDDGVALHLHVQLFRLVPIAIWNELTIIFKRFFVILMYNQEKVLTNKLNFLIAKIHIRFTQLKN